MVVKGGRGTACSACCLLLQLTGLDALVGAGGRWCAAACKWPGGAGSWPLQLEVTSLELPLQRSHRPDSAPCASRCACCATGGAAHHGLWLRLPLPADHPGNRSVSRQCTWHCVVAVAAACLLHAWQPAAICGFPPCGPPGSGAGANLLPFRRLLPVYYTSYITPVASTTTTSTETNSTASARSDGGPAVCLPTSAPVASFLLSPAASSLC